MPEPLDIAVLTTLAYFGHFRYPLTTFEVWKWLMSPVATPFADVALALETSPWLHEHVARHGGFWGIDDVAAQVEERRSRQADAAVKHRKAIGYARFLRRAPGIEGVAVCNSLAFHHTTSTSDIDLFVVASPRHTWTARLLATAPAIALRQRPHECKEHPICLSFFVSANALDMSKLQIDGDDPYFACWLVTLAPIIDRDDIFTRAWHANAWIRRRMGNAFPVRRARAFRIAARAPARHAPWFEAWAERLQRGRFPAAIRDLMNRDTRVVVSDSLLKFHDNDRRANIKAAHTARLKSYGIDRNDRDND